MKRPTLSRERLLTIFFVYALALIASIAAGTSDASHLDDGGVEATSDSAPHSR